MPSALYTPGDIVRMTHAVQPLLPDKYSLFKMQKDGKWAPSATYTDQPCSIQMVARLVPATGLQGQSETAPTRFVLRFNKTDSQVRARDRVIVTNHDTGEITKHTVESLRWPHSMPIWKLADLSDPE